MQEYLHRREHWSRIEAKQFRVSLIFSLSMGSSCEFSTVNEMVKYYQKSTENPYT